MSGVLCLKWNNHSSTFLKKLISLRSKECSCDVTIVCHGQHFPVHSLILSTCSEFFENIFEKTKCKHPFIILNDIEPRELEALLNYMYEGKINVLQDKLPALIKAAEDLKIKGLAAPDDAPPSIRSKDDFIEDEASGKGNIKCSKFQTKFPEKIMKKDYQMESSEHDQGSSNLNISHPDYINDVTHVKKECSEIDSTNDLDPSGNNPNSPYIDEAESQKDNLMIPIYSSEATPSMDECPTWMNNLQHLNKEESNFNSAKMQERVSKICGIRLTPDSDAAIQRELNLQSASQEVNFLDFSFPSTSSSNIDGSGSKEIRKQNPLKTLYSTEFEGSIRLRKESTDNSFCCTMCPFRCSRKSYLRLHFRVHTGERLYKCHTCMYSTAYKTNFKNHMLTHTGEKPFKCSKCSFRTTRKAYVINHMRTHCKESRKIGYLKRDVV